MHPQLTKWTDIIQTTFGLADYTLYSAVTSYEKNEWNQTDYRFTTEWLPPGSSAEEEGDLHPEGTAVVEIDVQTGRFTSVVFVGGKAPENGFSFSAGSKDQVIQWIEQQTGWTYGQQFIDSASNRNLSFRTAIGGIPVMPEGFIDVSLDIEGRLTFFAVHGEVPEQADAEPFCLKWENAEPVAQKRLVFVEIPAESEKKWLPVYMIDEQLIDNQTGKALPENREVLTWKTMKNKKVRKKLVQQTPQDIGENEIFTFPAHPDTKPITKKGLEKVREASLEFLQSYVPKESGDWALSHIQRAHGVIEARLTNIRDVSAVPRMWKLLLDKQSYDIISYEDSSWMLDQYTDFERADSPVLTKEEAFEKIKPHIQFGPVYFYDGKTCRLHGKVDAKAAVHAVTGDVLFF